MAKQKQAAGSLEYFFHQNRGCPVAVVSFALLQLTPRFYNIRGVNPSVSVSEYRLFSAAGWGCKIGLGILSAAFELGAVFLAFFSLANFAVVAFILAIGANGIGMSRRPVPR